MLTATANECIFYLGKVIEIILRNNQKCYFMPQGFYNIIISKKFFIRFYILSN